MNIDIQYNDNSEEVLRNVSQSITTALEKCGILAEGYAIDLCPVDTGRLRSSISHKVVGDSCYIGTNVEYAPYVECGTGSDYYPGGSPEARFQRAARPFLKPAASEHSEEYKSIIESELKR